MTRDYKSSDTRRARQCRCRGWFLGGLLLGLSIGAFAVYHWLVPDPPRGAGQAPRHARAKPAATGKTHFDFYSVLPEMEVKVPESAPPAERARVKRRPPRPSEEKSSARKPPKPPKRNARYLLQIASFRRAADADRLRARLALLGIETRIEKIRIDDRQRYHRVRAGPFSSERTLRQVRARLVDAGLKPITIRLKPTGD